MARPLGAWLAPPRFLLFLGLMAAGVPAGIALLGPTRGLMAGFDVAALAFLLACVPLLSDEAGAMRAAARRNDANRALLLVLTVGVTLVVLAAVAAELGEKRAPEPAAVVLILATLALAWLFSNIVYALHYAHIFYADDGCGGDAGGLDVPSAKEPDYWDFLYVSVTLGMTFQTSDVALTSATVRRVATGHTVAAFVFNLGILAFTINVLGGG